MKFNFYLLFLLLAGVGAFAQQPYSVTIEFPEKFPFDKVGITYGNGLTNTQYDTTGISRTVTISGDLFSAFGYVRIEKNVDLASNPFGHTFFFRPGNGVIRIVHSTDPTDPLSNFKLQNVYDADELGAAELKDATRNAWNAFKDYYIRYHDVFTSDPAVVPPMQVLADTVSHQTLAFVATHPSLFYSFWTFHQQFTGVAFVPVDSLLAIYQRFPEAFRNTGEGKQVLEALQARKDSTP